MLNMLISKTIATKKISHSIIWSLSHISPKEYQQMKSLLVKETVHILIKEATSMQKMPKDCCGIVLVSSIVILNIVSISKSKFRYRDNTNWNTKMSHDDLFWSPSILDTVVHHQICLDTYLKRGRAGCWSDHLHTELKLAAIQHPNGMFRPTLGFNIQLRNSSL